MKRPVAGAWAALARLVAVLAMVAGALWWWGTHDTPDLVADARLRLEPENHERLTRIHSVALEGGVYSGWRVDLRRPARYAVAVPGDDAVLRFRETYLEGRPRIAVRVVRADGEREEVWVDDATSEQWSLRRVPLPVTAGETVDVEIAALDGGARMNLGAVYLADVVLESSGRQVDETDVPVEARAIERDLLVDRTGRVTAPPHPIAESLGQPGPPCVRLDRDEPLHLDVEELPDGARVDVVVHVAPTEATWTPGRLTITDPAVGELASFELDGALGPLGLHDEFAVSLELDGRRAPLSLTFLREGGDNLFVGLRDVSLSGLRSQPRSRFDPEFGKNVLLVVVDGLRPERIGAFGDAYAITPHLDALAERGIRYTDLHAPSSWAMPSVASLFTGLSPLSHGIGLVEGVRLSPRAVTLAQSAQWAGMSTALIASSPASAWVHGLGRGYELHDANAALPASSLVDRAIDWIENQRDFEWFLTLHLDDPAFPHQIVTEPGHDLPTELDPALLERLAAYDPRPGAADRLAAEIGTLYAAEVSRVDYALGRLFDHLRSRGLLERTLVVVVGSCGQEFLEHGGRENGRTLYDEVTRVPAIVAGPGVRRGPIVVDTPSELVDVTRLIGQLANLRAGNAMQGRLPEPFGALPGSEPVLSAVLVPGAGSTVPWLMKARHDGFSYYRDVRSGREQLYDLRADPGETRDLAPQADEGELSLRLETLSTAAQRWGQTCWGASWPWAVPRAP